VAGPWLPGGFLPLWPSEAADPANPVARTSGAAGARTGAGAIAGVDPQNPMDAATTALEFTRAFLGYTGVDHVTTTETGLTETGLTETGLAEALVGVGSVTESGEWVIHFTARRVGSSCAVAGPALPGVVRRAAGVVPR
jgi:hypothetical protein